MRLDLAMNLKLGDVVYNCFMEPLTIYDKTIYTADTHPSSNCLQLVVKDVNSNLHNYAYQDLYFQDLEDEDDAERGWVNWAKDNKDFFYTFDHIETMKEVYKTAFCHGFEHKRKISHEEAMQK